VSQGPGYALECIATGDTKEGGKITEQVIEAKREDDADQERDDDDDGCGHLVQVSAE